MGIVADLTPVKYKPIRLVVEIRPDETLTVDSLSFHTDIDILNVDDRTLGRDHPNPLTTAQQKTLLLTWVVSNLSTYETNTELTRYTE